MKKTLFLLVTLLITQLVFAQQFVPNYDESKVPKFVVPDPLVTFHQKKVKNVKDWEKKRRPELIKIFTQNMFGEIPEDLRVSSVEILEQSENAYNSQANRKQVLLHFEKNGKKLGFTILIYLPKNVEKAPLFLGYNFYGNHTITDDADVIISEAWVDDNPSFGIINNQLTEQSRGVRTNRWAIEKMLEAGFGVATIYYGEVDPDKNDFTDGVHPLLYKKEQEKPAVNEWGSIAAWSWGLSRAMDYFETDSDIDASKVIVFGHSRLGKTSLWAGATDQRFAAVISNNSGCGGAAVSKRKFGETIGRINTAFPHWFCDNFKNYNNKEEQMPFDQHELLALIAPRPLYVASAEEDQWADPKGELLGAYYATPVYSLYGKKGITITELPPVNQPIFNTVAYHIRTGKHDVTEYDWEQYIKWAKEQLNIE
ncbi:MAG: hypothetical protein AB7S72_17070 [Draconibacterium sp.]